MKYFGKNPYQASDWVRIPGHVTGVMEKSVVYLRPGELFSKKVYIPRSQIEITPRVDDTNIVVKRWLAEKNGWAFWESTNESGDLATLINPWLTSQLAKTASK